LIFGKKNISYKFIKPKNLEDLIIWIKCMFYNKSFLEAYTKTSRTDMTMRLSTFVKGKIIKNIVNIDDYLKNRNVLIDEMFTMEEYYYNQIKELNEIGDNIIDKYEKIEKIKICW